MEGGHARVFSLSWGPGVKTALGMACTTRHGARLSRANTAPTALKIV